MTKEGKDLKCKCCSCSTLEGTAAMLGMIGAACLIVASSVLEAENTLW